MKSKILIDFIDSCVWIDPYQKSIEKSTNYLNLVGYQSQNVRRNIGAITVPILGEIKTMIITKINDPDFRTRISKDIINIISELRKDKKLRIYKFRNIKDSMLDEIKEVDYSISEDDALHICFAINMGCQNFVTTDEKILNSNVLKSWLRKNKELIIKEPY